jgi:hypothetical protein
MPRVPYTLLYPTPSYTLLRPKSIFCPGESNANDARHGGRRPGVSPQSIIFFAVCIDRFLIQGMSCDACGPCRALRTSDCRACTLHCELLSCGTTAALQQYCRRTSCTRDADASRRPPRHRWHGPRAVRVRARRGPPAPPPPPGASLAATGHAVHNAPVSPLHRPLVLAVQ